MSTTGFEACRACREDVEHCHGTVIHHALSAIECTEDDCTDPQSVHGFSIDCDAIGCVCSVTVVVRGVVEAS